MGDIWKYTGAPCGSTSCPSWLQLDNSPVTSGIFADGSELYQLQTNGLIWRFTGTPGSWQMLDNNPTTVTLAAGGGQLYQLRNNGDILYYTGTTRRLADA